MPGFGVCSFYASLKALQLRGYIGVILGIYSCYRLVELAGVQKVGLLEP